MAIVLNGATSGNVTIDANAISGTSVITLPVGSGTFPLMNLSTAVATTSGNAIDFTSIPSWVKRITVMFNGVSTNGSFGIQVQIGSGSIITSGYTSTCNATSTSGVSSNNSTIGFFLIASNAGFTMSGSMILTLINTNTWISTHVCKIGTGHVISGGGDCTALAGSLDRVRISTLSLLEAFDAGSVNILMEGY
jgi:hypothetical protein